MIEGEPRSPLHLQPGPERRALKRKMNVSISRDDFSQDEWVEVEAVAPRMVADFKAMFIDSALDYPAGHVRLGVSA